MGVIGLTAPPTACQSTDKTLVHGLIPPAAEPPLTEPT